MSESNRDFSRCYLLTVSDRDRLLKLLTRLTDAVAEIVDLRGIDFEVPEWEVPGHAEMAYFEQLHNMTGTAPLNNKTLDEF